MKLVILCSFILSILHSILFYGQRIGISMFLFTIVGIFLLMTILIKNNKIKNKKAIIIAIPIILLSSTYFIFNNTLLNITNMIAIIILFGIMSVTISTTKTQNIVKEIAKIFIYPFEKIGDTTKIISNQISVEKEHKEKNKSKIIKQILKGILISLPLIIVILILLSTADQLFAKIFGDIFLTLIKNINIITLISTFFRILISLAIFIYIAGLIIKIINPNQNETKENKIKNKIKIEGITINTILTLINLIYLIFAITQGIYLIEQINNSNINYAQYARNGFFQLMIISIINFTIIFISKNNSKELNNANKKYTTIMNILTAIFTIIILVSSVIRMKIYEQEYGYTFLRLIVYFIQITELILIIPTIIYIIKDKFKILKYYISIITIMYVIMNFSNLDYIIAKGNIDRYLANQKENKIDFRYIANKTSTDAIPEIIRLVNVENKILKVDVNNYLYYQYCILQDKQKNIQEFNLSECKAKKELEKLDLNHIEKIPYYER